MRLFIIFGSSKMLAKILFACAFVSVALAAPRNVPNCDKFPNGTDTKVNWYMCDDIKNDGTIFSMKFQDVNTGKDEYPISLKRPVNVLMDVSQFLKSFIIIKIVLRSTRPEHSAAWFWILISFHGEDLPDVRGTRSQLSDFCKWFPFLFWLL